MELSPSAHKIMSNAEEYAEQGVINIYHIMLGLDLYVLESGQESQLSDEDREKLKGLARQINEDNS